MPRASRRGIIRRGYKLSEVTIELSVTFDSSRVSMHIYSANTGNRRPNSSVFQMVSPDNGGRDVTFTAPGGARLSPNTDYHVAMVASSSPNVNCYTAEANRESPGSASDWSVASTYQLNASGNSVGGAFLNGRGCAIRTPR